MNVIINWLIRLGLGEAAAVLCARVLAVVAMLGVACIAYIIAKRFLLRIVKRLVERSKTIWDDILLERKVFNRFSYFAPALVLLDGAICLIGILCRHKHITTRCQNLHGHCRLARI